MRMFPMRDGSKGLQAMRSSLLLTLITILATALSPATARANDVNTDITLQGGTNYFGALHFDDLDFTDVFTVDVAGSVIANMSLITIGAGANNIDFLSADLNGYALTLTSAQSGFLETGFLTDTELSGPLVLTVRGRSGATGGTFASYSGTLNVSIIPEPTIAVLMGLGLGGLSFGARRARVG